MLQFSVKTVFETLVFKFRFGTHMTYSYSISKQFDEIIIVNRNQFELKKTVTGSCLKDFLESFTLLATLIFTILMVSCQFLIGCHV